MNSNFTVLQNWKSLQLKCGVLGCCLPLLVHQYHASTSEIEIISIGIHDLAASQHQFLDDTKPLFLMMKLHGEMLIGGLFFHE